MSQGTHLDACPIRTLLGVVERVVSCGVRCFFLINAASSIGVESIECGGDGHLSRYFIFFLVCTTLVSSTVLYFLVQGAV